MKWVANFLVFCLTQIVLVSFQTSLWMQVLGNFPPPQLWLPAFVYWALYRKPPESIAMLYLTVFIAGSLTALPYSLLLLILIAIYVGLFFLKERIYWSGSTFFMLACGFSILLFPITHFIFSWFMEANPIHDPELFNWIISILLTMLCALPLYHLFSLIDHFIRPLEGRKREGVL